MSPMMIGPFCGIDPAPAALPRDGCRLTVGVEEEFVVVDRRTGAPVARGPRVVKAATEVLGMQIQEEFLGAQVEVCTRPTVDLGALRSELALLRKVMGEVAADEGCLLMASGTPVIPPGASSDRDPE
ncbi:glutamate-cysteine ligase family protein [Streptomyces sp. NPDC090741]|uniref:glutamate-cysteine ligase family protein n=1 Tax=Streptomyces sp. NPDC090741 TaxID=3365967 RepID=UPI0038083373